jgi:hypothetical protein
MRLSPNLPQVDQQDIYNALTLLHAPGSVVDLRIPNAVTGQRGLHKKYRSTVAGFYNDFAALAQEAVTWSGKSDGVYITLNTITPDLLARYANRVEEGAEALTNDRHVIRRYWLPIDFDATRLAKISATDAEHEAALQRARTCRAWLHEQRWPEPLSADSGNGTHLLYRLDLPNDEASTRLVARTLQALALLFNDTHVTVDETTFNAARVWKLYGTLVCKGDHIPQRPYRVARLLDVPDALIVVTREHLAALAALVPEPSISTQHSHTTPLEPFDLMRWIVHHALPVASHGP